MHAAARRFVSLAQGVWDTWLRSLDTAIGRGAESSVCLHPSKTWRTFLYLSLFPFTSLPSSSCYFHPFLIDLVLTTHKLVDLFSGRAALRPVHNPGASCAGWGYGIVIASKQGSFGVVCLRRAGRGEEARRRSRMAALDDEEIGADRHRRHYRTRPYYPNLPPTSDVAASSLQPPPCSYSTPDSLEKKSD